MCFATFIYYINQVFSLQAKGEYKILVCNVFNTHCNQDTYTQRLHFCIFTDTILLLWIKQSSALSNKN